MKYSLAIKREKTADTHNHINKTQTHDFEQKKEVTYKGVYRIIIFIWNFRQKSILIYSDRNQIEGDLGLGGKEKRNFLGW